MKYLKQKILREGKVKEGGRKLREAGLNLHSLAIVEFDEKSGIVFR